MKPIVVREIHSVIFTVPSSSAPSSSLTSTPAPNKHIRFGADPKKKEQEKKEEKKTLRNGHVQYYSVITLNQIVLSPADQAVAVNLINIYFDIFKEVLGTLSSSASPNPSATRGDDADHDNEDGDVKLDSKGRILDKRGKPTKNKSKTGGDDKEVKGAAGFVEIEDAQSRLVSAVLTGVNRAVPFAKLGSEEGSG
jgi:ribosome biogenesis protein MAK21